MAFPVLFVVISDKIPRSLIQTDVIEETGIVLPLKNSLRFYNGLKSKYTFHKFKINHINRKRHFCHRYGRTVHCNWSQRLLRGTDNDIFFEYLWSVKCQEIMLSKNQNHSTFNISKWKVPAFTRIIWWQNVGLK